MSGARFDLTTVGEALIRLSASPGLALDEVDRLRLSVGGAEANVAAHLARMGHAVAWNGVIADGMVGDIALSRLRAAGIELGGVRRRDGRMGLYFVEHPVDGGVTQVVYDRAGSAGASLTPADIDWDALLNTRLLFLTGITTALSDGSRAVVAEAVRLAREAGIPIAFDVNHRAKLWSADEARSTLLPLLRGVDVLLCSRRDAVGVLGIADGSDAEVLDGLAALGGPRRIALTLGPAGVLIDDQGRREAVPGRSVAVLDGIGAGDALAAGALSGLLDEPASFAAGVRRGVRMAEIALQRHGDAPVIRTRHLLPSDDHRRIDR